MSIIIMKGEISSAFASRQGSSQEGRMADIVMDEETKRQFEAFIGSNAGYYVEKFGKFNIDGVETFQATWNWSAFLFTFWWMLYRKMYLWSLVTFIVLTVPYVGLAAWVACGIAGNYLYFRHARGRIEEARSVSPTDIHATLAKLGGTHEWVKVVAVIITGLALLVLILVGGLVALFDALR
jgi:hypothetical protein